MFNTQNDIAITLNTPAGQKNITVKYPSDEQWIKRLYNSKLVSKPMGRGKSTTETLNAEQVNAALLGEIKLSGDELDAFEASKVIDRLSRCELLDATREGSQFVITLKAAGSTLVHTLKMPSAKQVTEYRREVVSIIDGRRGAQEMRMNLRPSGFLYDALVISSEGYDSPVPVIHKSTVVNEILSLLDAEEDDSEVEGF